MRPTEYDIITIGGSSGSFYLMKHIINSLPADIRVPVVVIIHRMKNVESRLNQVFSSSQRIIEPEDKDPLKSGYIYLAPQNYHLLIEENKTFALDYSEHINHSRPSIDVTFMSVSDIYKNKTIGILLSGANKDGAEGLQKIAMNGGRSIVQDPATAEFPFMPESALKLNPDFEIQTPDEILNTILNTLTK